MKKILSLILIFLLALSGCSKNNNTEQLTTTPAEQGDIVISPTDETTDVIQIVKEGKYYQVTRCGFMFSYSLYDKDKNVVKTVDSLSRQPHVGMVDDRVVCVYIQAGTGIATRSTYYYDVENNRFSESHNAVFDYCNGLLVHADHDKVIVRSAFDNSFYQEFTDFSDPFSPVAFPFVNICFIEDGQSIEVTYHSGDDYTEVTEIFDIN